MPGDWIGARERGGPIGAVGTIARGAMLGVVFGCRESVGVRPEDESVNPRTRSFFSKSVRLGGRGTWCDEGRNGD